MKSFFNIFFTMPAKIIFTIILVVLSFGFGDCHVNYFNLYNEDSESFINAITQHSSFNYETSHYYKNTVRKAIDDITKLTMDYEEVFENGVTVEKLLKHYNSIGDTSFAKIYRELSEISNLKFAVVNHGKQKIYSNIPSINRKSSATNVRKYFSASSKNLLIARSCKNPYFATDHFIEFAEHIRDTAKKYEDNFDLYISFGTEESFAANEKKFEERHFAMRDKIKNLNHTLLIYFAALVVLCFILLTVTGKQEMGGKTYPTVINRLPNDLIIIIYLIVLLCLSSLYRTAFSMLISHGNELDEFWFTHSHEFYIDRIRMCIVLSVCSATNLICILKREYKLGLIFKNTYIYTYINNLRKIKKTDKTDF